MASGYSGITTTATAAIANGQQESAAVDMGGFTLSGIFFPAAFTGTTLTFEAASSLTGTYLPVYNSAGAVSYTVAQGRFLAVDPKDFQGIQYLKIKSGSAEAAARTVGLALRGF